MAPSPDNPEPCPRCGSTNIHTQEERWRKWVIDATCLACGHHWKLSN